MYGRVEGPFGGLILPLHYTNSKRENQPTIVIAKKEAKINPHERWILQLIAGERWITRSGMASRYDLVEFSKLKPDFAESPFSGMIEYRSV